MFGAWKVQGILHKISQLLLRLSYNHPPIGMPLIKAYQSCRKNVNGLPLTLDSGSGTLEEINGGTAAEGRVAGRCLTRRKLAAAVQKLSRPQNGRRIVNLRIG